MEIPATFDPLYVLGDMDDFLSSMNEIWNYSTAEIRANITLTSGYQIGYSIEGYDTASPTEVILLYNSSWVHSLPLLVTTMSNTLLHKATGNMSNVRMCAYVRALYVCVCGCIKDLK